MASASRKQMDNAAITKRFRPQDMTQREISGKVYAFWDKDLRDKAVELLKSAFAGSIEGMYAAGFSQSTEAPHFLTLYFVPPAVVDLEIQALMGIHAPVDRMYVTQPYPDKPEPIAKVTPPRFAHSSREELLRVVGLLNDAEAKATGARIELGKQEVAYDQGLEQVIKTLDSLARMVKGEVNRRDLEERG